MSQLPMTERSAFPSKIPTGRGEQLPFGPFRNFETKVTKYKAYKNADDHSMAVQSLPSSVPL